MVKGRDKKGRLFLIDGNNSDGPTGIIGINNGDIFKMRYREVWANWLLCAALSFANQQDFSFQENEDGDGVILNRSTGKWFTVEHVSAMTYDKGERLPEGNDRIIWALNKKVKKDEKHPGYADGKVLVIFVDGCKNWVPNQVGRAIDGKHKFKHVYCVALIDVHSDGSCSYSVTSFEKKHSPCFRVQINKDFTDWKVIQDQ